MVEGMTHGLKDLRADGTALTGTFEHKQTVVDLAPLCR